MPPSTADLRPGTPAVQHIPGGACALFPMHFCLLWAAWREEAISPLAFRVYFAAHEVKFWRSKTKPGRGYHYEPIGFQPDDICRLVPDASEASARKAFGELKNFSILNMTDAGIHFADSLDEVSLPEHVKARALAMYHQLHPHTRDTLMKIPRRLLKLIIQCGKRVVRIATLMGMLITTMLTKRTGKYGGYKGCCKAEWIALVFGVNDKRANLERARLINEGWFTREPTTVSARKKYGQWVRLNLDALRLATDLEPIMAETAEVEEPTAEVSAVELPATTTMPQVQPQDPPQRHQVQPLFNQFLSPSGEIEDNQVLTREAQPPGVELSKETPEPSWKDIQPQDLRDDERSNSLWQEAIDLGHLKPTQPDRLNFFAAMAHALRVAKTNACGLLRTLVEKSLWQFVSQADEHHALERLLRMDTETTPGAPFGCADPLAPPQAGRIKSGDDAPVELSEDALIVQTLTADLARAGASGDAFRLARQYGYLCDWDQVRWERAEVELAQARLLWARQRNQATSFTSLEAIIEADRDEDGELHDGF